jgi:hypothetical protein
MIFPAEMFAVFFAQGGDLRVALYGPACGK